MKKLLFTQMPVFLNIICYIFVFVNSGKAYFRGPWLVTPPEIPHSPNRLFYKQEVFLSSLEDSNPLVGIVGKCAVLDYNDYISSKFSLNIISYFYLFYKKNVICESSASASVYAYRTLCKIFVSLIK